MENSSRMGLPQPADSPKTLFQAVAEAKEKLHDAPLKSNFFGRKLSLDYDNTSGWRVRELKLFERVLNKLCNLLGISQANQRNTIAALRDHKAIGLPENIKMLGFLEDENRYNTHNEKLNELIKCVVQFVEEEGDPVIGEQSLRFLQKFSSIALSYSLKEKQGVIARDNLPSLDDLEDHPMSESDSDIEASGSDSEVDHSDLPSLDDIESASVASSDVRPSSIIDDASDFPDEISEEVAIFDRDASIEERQNFLFGKIDDGIDDAKSFASVQQLFREDPQAAKALLLSALEAGDIGKSSVQILLAFPEMVKFINEVQDPAQKEWVKKIYTDSPKMIRNVLTYAIINSEDTIVREIFQFAKDNGLVEVLQKQCTMYDFLGGSNILKKAKLFGRKDVLAIFDTFGVKQEKEAHLDSIHALSKLKSFGAQLFDSVNLQTSELYDGGDPEQTLCELLEDLIDYQREIRGADPAVQAKVAEVIQELQEAYKTNLLKLHATDQELRSFLVDSIGGNAGAFNMDRLQALEAFDPSIPLSQRPCVTMIGGSSHHAVVFTFQRDGDNTFTFMIENTGDGVDPLAQEENGRIWVQDVQYQGLEIGDGKDQINASLIDTILQGVPGDKGVFNPKFGKMTDTLKFIDEKFGNVRKTHSERIHKTQQHGTCYVKCLTSWLRGRLKSTCAAHFKAWRSRKLVDKMFPQKGESLWDLVIKSGKLQLTAEQLDEINSGKLKSTAEAIVTKREGKAENIWGEALAPLPEIDIPE